MPVLVDQTTEKPVACRCPVHAEVPVLNRKMLLVGGHSMECGACCLDQAADALVAQLGELIEQAAIRLEFFEAGTGDQLRHSFAGALNRISGEPTDG